MTAGPTVRAPSAAPTCPLCAAMAADDPAVLHADPHLRVVRADEPGHPCFFRIVWNTHVAETTDLVPDDRARLWRVLLALETAVRREIGPAKINLATLGNRVPHLHWHLIGRWPDDPHFPDSVWSAVVRDTPAAVLAARRAAVDAALPALARAVSRALSAGAD